MTPDPVVVEADATLEEAARAMAENDIGAEIVIDGDRVAGIVTDRDIVVRAVAEGRIPGETPVREVCTTDIVTVEPDARVDEVIRMMRERDIRRVPVVEGDEPVGIVTIGDLAVERDPDSTLGDISSAPPNN
jgi:CBS domain-containing protein